MFTIINNLEENDELQMFLPTELFSNNGIQKTQNSALSTMIAAGTLKLLRVQINRIRSIDNIWGFQMFGGLGDKYDEKIRVSYQADDTKIKIDMGLNSHIIFVQLMIIP